MQALPLPPTPTESADGSPVVPFTSYRSNSPKARRRLRVRFQLRVRENRTGRRTKRTWKQILVPGVGLEPTRPYGHQHLKLARLPIPPPGQVDFLKQPWASLPAAFVVRTPCLSRTSGSCPALSGSDACSPYGVPSPGRSACIEAARRRRISTRRRTQTWYTTKLVPKRGLEPLRPFGHCDLNAARLPIPPPGQVELHDVAHYTAKLNLTQQVVGRPERIQTSDLSVRSAALCSTELRACLWRGRQDSNLRIPGSEPGALGLSASLPY